MNKIILVGIVVSIVVIGGFLLLRGDNQSLTEPDANTPSLEVPAPGQQEVPETIVASNETEEEQQQEEQVVLSNEIRIVSGFLFFNPKKFTLTKDQPAKITLQNSGTHTFTIDEFGVDVVLRGSPETVEFTPTKSGVFEYYCAIPGHREGGMFGTVTVE